MDRYEHIENTRFLGAEFLTWLWFKIELFEGQLALSDGRAADGWMDTRLVLGSPDNPRERVALRGQQPSASAEAASALRQGKVPMKAALRLSVGVQEYTFTFDAKTFAVSGVKLPAVLGEESDEPVYERLRLIEQLDQILGELYTEFLNLRVAAEWDRTLAPAMRAWVRGKLTLTKRQYAGLVQRASQGKRK
jgi:hypothetical protein